MIQPASAAEIGTRWSRSARKGRKVAKIAKNQKYFGFTEQHMKYQI